MGTMFERRSGRDRRDRKTPSNRHDGYDWIKPDRRGRKVERRNAPAICRCCGKSWSEHQ